MGFRGYFYFIVTALVSVRAEAFLSCTQIFFAATPAYEMVAQEDVPDNFLDQVQYLIDDLNSKLLGPLNSPNDIKILVRKQAEWSSHDYANDADDSDFDEEGLEAENYEFQPATRRLFITQLVPGPTGKIKNPQIYLNHIAHEWGHAIVDANLHFSPTLDRTFATMRSIITLQEKSENNLVLLDALQETEGTEYKKIHEENNIVLAQIVKLAKDEKGLEYKKLSDENNLLMDQILKLKEQHADEINFAISMLDAYGELIADLTAVLYTQDGRAMRDAHYHVGEKENLYKTYRDFTTRQDLSNWKQNSDVYGGYLPVKTFLWENYLKNGRYFNSRRADFLHQIVRIVLEHVEERIKNPLLHDLDAQTRNQMLIERLHAGIR